MARQVGTLYARQHWRELLECAGKGQTTVITRHGQPIAAIVPPGEVREEPRASLLALAGSGHGLWGQDAAAAIQAQREEWE